MSTHRNFYELAEEVADLRRQVVRLVGLIQEPPDKDRSIEGFCRRQNISKSFFYKLKEQGKAPRVAHVGARRIVTPEAERDWVRDREREGEVATTSRASLTAPSGSPAPLTAPSGRAVAGVRSAAGGGATR